MTHGTNKGKAMPRYSFTLTGRTSLLMHANDIDAADALDEWRKNPANKNVSKPGDDRSPAWTWIASVYTDGEVLAIPSDNLAVCLRQAGARVIMKGQKTFKESAVSGIWIEDEFLPVLVANKTVPLAPISELHDEKNYKAHVDAVKDLGFVLFAKRAKIGQSMHIRVRPRFDQWSVSGTIDVSAQEITPEVVARLFEEAGKVGLGDWRPGCKTPGRFGMFNATVKAIK